MLGVRSAHLGICLAFLVVGGLPASSLLARSESSHGLAVQTVRPGQSIQAAINRAAEGGAVFILPGVYREAASAVNGLEITRAIQLVGLSTRTNRVVLRSSGSQSNGIVVVPEDRTDCRGCHRSLSPPFTLFSGVPHGLKMRDPMIRDITIRGITIVNFSNNGLFTENVDGFSIVDVESIGNKNYGIFPTLSKNGMISRSRVTGALDSGVWVETSENILVANTLVEGNVVGIEVSNSDNIVLSQNESRNNSVGIGVFLLPFLFDDRPGTKRITIERNSVHHNNRPNDATPGTILSELPSGSGIILMGADESRIARNRIERNGLVGIALIDHCIATQGGSHDCASDPSITPEFLADQEATNNRVEQNVLVNNGMSPPPHPFAFAASDLALVSAGEGNCYRRNTFRTSFSILGSLPPCRVAR